MHLAPDRQVGILDASHLCHPGAVHKDVQTAEVFHYILNGSGRLTLVGEVGGQDERLTACLLHLTGEVLQPLRPARHDSHPRPRGSERERRAPADAGRGAGDERHLPR